MLDKLSSKQKRALMALLSSGTRREAADRAGVSERTIARWLSDKRFRTALSAVQSQVLDQTSARLVGAQADAINQLLALLHSDKEHISMRAADLIISYALKYIEMREIDRRLTDIEAHIWPG